MRRFSVALFLAGLCAAAACSRERKPPSRIVSDTTRPAEQWLQIEPVRLLRDYIRIDTSSKKTEEAGARFLRDLLECEGIPAELVCPAPGRCNVLAGIRGKRREGALLLLSHIDVVEAYPELWKDAAPFGGVIKGGYLYGRGAYDMKSLGLAQVLALADLKRHGVVPESDILLLAEADEEMGQRWGSKWLLEHRPEWFEGVTVVLNEGGTTEMILRDVRFWGLETVQAGFAAAEFGAPTPLPLEKLAGRWKKLASTPVAPHPHVVLGFDMLANHLLNPLTDPLRHLDRVRRNPQELALLPDRYGAFLEARIFWTEPFSDPPGASENQRMYMVVSTPPGIDPGSFVGPIYQDAARSGVERLTFFSSGPTQASPYPTRFTELIKRVTESRYPGVPFGPVPTFGGATTSIYYRARGIPAYGFSPIPMNITDSVRRHGNDERIFLRDYLTGLELYSDIVAEYAQKP